MRNLRMSQVRGQRDEVACDRLTPRRALLQGRVAKVCRLCRVRHKRHSYASLLIQQGESLAYV